MVKIPARRSSILRKHSLIQKEDERTADKKIIIARAAKATIMSYLYDAHSDWLKQRAKINCSAGLEGAK